MAGVEGINFAPASYLSGLTLAPQGISYVFAYDTTNGYIRFLDGVAVGGQRIAYYSDLPGAATVAANRVYAGPASGSAATPAFRSLAVADIPTKPPSAVQTAAFTIDATKRAWRCDTTTGAFSATQPASPADGDRYLVKDVTGAAGTNAIGFVGTVDGAVNPTLVAVARGWAWIEWNAVTNEWNLS